MNEAMVLKINDYLNSVTGFAYFKDKDSIYLGCNNNFSKIAELNSANEIIGTSDYHLHWKKQAHISWYAPILNNIEYFGIMCTCISTKISNA